MADVSPAKTPAERQDRYVSKSKICCHQRTSRFQVDHRCCPTVYISRCKRPDIKNSIIVRTTRMLNRGPTSMNSLKRVQVLRYSIPEGRYRSGRTVHTATLSFQTCCACLLLRTRNPSEKSRTLASCSGESSHVRIQPYVDLFQRTTPNLVGACAIIRTTDSCVATAAAPDQFQHRPQKKLARPPYLSFLSNRHTVLVVFPIV